MDWFKGCETPQEIKKHYRSLAMQYHPDKGGDTATMQEINDAYHVALENVNGFQTTDESGSTHTYHYNRETEQKVMDKIFDLLHCRMAGTEIWLIGFWIWIKGDTKPHRQTLRNQKCIWHSKRGAWYWKPYKSKSRYDRRTDFEGLADRYGARMFEQKDDEVDTA